MGNYRTFMSVLKILLYPLIPLGILMLLFVGLVVAIIDDYKYYKQYGNKSIDEMFSYVAQRTMDVLKDITGEDVGPFRTENIADVGGMHEDNSAICGSIILDKPLSDEFVDKLHLCDLPENREMIGKYGVSRVYVYFVNRRELILRFSDSYGECGEVRYSALLRSIEREDVENCIKANFESLKGLSDEQLSSILRELNRIPDE